MTAGCPVVVAGGTEGFGTGDTGYSAEHFVAEGTGAEDTGNFVVGVDICFGAKFSVCFVNFHPSPPHVLYLHHI